MTEFGEKTVTGVEQRITDRARHIMSEAQGVVHEFSIDATGRDNFKARMHVGKLAAQDSPDGHSREVVVTHVDLGGGDTDTNVMVSFLHTNPALRERAIAMVDCFQLEGGILVHDQTALEVDRRVAVGLAHMLEMADFSDTSLIEQVRARSVGGYYAGGSWRRVHYDGLPFEQPFGGTYQPIYQM